MRDAKNAWSSYSRQHSKTISYKALEAMGKLIPIQDDPSLTPEQKKTAREGIERMYGKDPVHEAERKLKLFEAGEGKPKGAKKKASSSRRLPQASEGSSRSHHEGHQQTSEQKDPQASSDLFRTSKAAAEQHTLFLKHQRERLRRQQEKAEKKREEWLEEQEEKRVGVEQMREEYEQQRKAKEDREREKRKAKYAKRKAKSKGGQQQEEKDLAEAQSQEALRAAQALQLKKERQQQETEAQRTKEAAKEPKDPKVELSDHGSPKGSSGTSSTHTSVYGEQDEPPGTRKKRRLRSSPRAGSLSSMIRPRRSCRSAPPKGPNACRSPSWT